MRTLLRHARRSDRGFTLIELLIVIVILGVLAAIVVFAVGAFNDRGVNAACQADQKTVEVAVEAYRAKNGTYPNSESDDPSGWTQLVDEGFLREAPSSTNYQIHLGTNGEVTSDCDTPGAQPSASTSTEPGGGGASPSPSASNEPAGPVSGITLSGQTASTVHVSWTAPTTGGPFSQYMIWAFQGSGATQCGTPFIGSAWAYTFSPTATQVDVSLTSLTAGQTYNMCVQAIVPESNGALDGPAGYVTFTQMGGGAGGGSFTPVTRQAPQNSNRSGNSDYCNGNGNDAGTGVILGTGGYSNVSFANIPGITAGSGYTVTVYYISTTNTANDSLSLNVATGTRSVSNTGCTSVGSSSVSWTNVTLTGSPTITVSYDDGPGSGTRHVLIDRIVITRP